MTGSDPISLTGQEISRLVGGTLSGPETDSVMNVQILENAGPHDATFVGDLRNLSRLRSSAARFIIVPESIASKLAEYSDRTFLIVRDDPETVFLLLAAHFYPARRPRIPSISATATIADSAVLGPECNVQHGAVVGNDVVMGTGCDIGAGVVIGDGCQLGDHVIIHANAVLYEDVIIGNDVIIHATCVLGADGFGYRQVNGQHERLPHLGTVRVCDNVEIGAGTTIDRAKVGETVIGAGTKIDNQVMIGHNCQIGEHNLLVSQSGFAGSVSTGSYVICAGQSGIADHVHLGDGAVIGAKAGVHRDMPGGQPYLGIPAGPATEHARQVMALKRLPEVRSTVKQLQKQVAELQQQIQSLTAGQSGESRAA